MSIVGNVSLTVTDETAFSESLDLIIVLADRSSTEAGTW